MDIYWRECEKLVVKEKFVRRKIFCDESDDGNKDEIDSTLSWIRMKVTECGR